jgi:hypothetical protein
MSAKIPEQTRELARALLKAGRTYRDVAEAIQVSVGTVHNIAKEPYEDIEPLAAEIRRRFSMKYLLLADHVLGKITDMSIAKASLKDRALAAAILTDKAVQLEAKKSSRKATPPATGHLNGDERDKNPATG